MIKPAPQKIEPPSPVANRCLMCGYLTPCDGMAMCHVCWLANPPNPPKKEKHVPQK